MKKDFRNLHKVTTTNRIWMILNKLYVLLSFVIFCSVRQFSHFRLDSSWPKNSLARGAPVAQAVGTLCS